jgi:hypothetical protein
MCGKSINYINHINHTININHILTKPLQTCEENKQQLSLFHLQRHNHHIKKTKKPEKIFHMF